MELWDERFLGLSLYYSSFSKDPSTKVGCVLVNELNIPVGFGYNGFSRESNDKEEQLHERSLKYPRTIHAEENAIFNSTRDVRGTTAFLTHPPCIPCITRLSQNGISHVVFFVSNSDEFNERWSLDESIKEMDELCMTYKLVEATSKDKMQILSKTVSRLTL